MKQLTKIEELIGKTISKIILSYGDFYIKFSDESFVVLETRNLAEGSGYSDEQVSIDEFIKDASDEILLELGLVTQLEYDLACEEEKKAYQKRKEEADLAEKKANEERELQILHKLEAKYRK